MASFLKMSLTFVCTSTRVEFRIKMAPIVNHLQQYTFRFPLWHLKQPKKVDASSILPRPKELWQTLQNSILEKENSCRNSSWDLLCLSKQPFHECWVCFKPLFDIWRSRLLYQCISFTSIFNYIKQGSQTVFPILFTVFKPENKTFFLQNMFPYGFNSKPANYCMTNI